MEFLSELLPIIIYILLIALLIVAIILGIKFILTMNKVDDVIEDLNGKLGSLDKLFNIIDFTTDRVSIISDTIVNFVTTRLKKIFKKKKVKKLKEDEDNE